MGDRRTPMKPAAKARDIRATDAPPFKLISRGKVLLTNPTVRPVIKPVISGNMHIMGKRGTFC